VHRQLRQQAPQQQEQVLQPLAQVQELQQPLQVQEPRQQELVLQLQRLLLPLLQQPFLQVLF
jgi:hypothetical protein